MKGNQIFTFFSLSELEGVAAVFSGGDWVAVCLNLGGPGQVRSSPAQSCHVWFGPVHVWSGPVLVGPVQNGPVCSELVRSSLIPCGARLVWSDCVPAIASWHTRGVAKPLGFMLKGVYWVSPKTSLICIDRLELSGHKNQFRWRAMNAI